MREDAPPGSPPWKPPRPDAGNRPVAPPRRLPPPDAPPPQPPTTTRPRPSHPVGLPPSPVGGTVDAEGAVAMETILITVFLFGALAIASVLWGVDSRGLDTRTPPQPSLQTPRTMADGD